VVKTPAVTGLELKAFTKDRPRSGLVRREYLKSNFTAPFKIQRLVDRAHPSGGNAVKDLVPPDLEATIRP
jgi:hypothetical protein